MTDKKNARFRMTEMKKSLPRNYKMKRSLLLFPSPR
jgi:hypothetical protein